MTKITKHELGVGWVKRSAPIRKMENGNDARIMRRQTYNETGFVETNLMGLLCVTHPTLASRSSRLIKLREGECIEIEIEVVK